MKLPPYCYYLDNGDIRYKPSLGRQNGKLLWAKPVIIAKAGTPMSRVWAAWEQLQGGVSVDQVMLTYLKSKHVTELSQSTRESYEHAYRVFSETEVNGQIIGSLGANDLTPKMLRVFLDDYPSPISASRAVAFLKAAYNFARQRQDGIDKNPCDGVTLNRATPRTRLLTVDEIYAAIALANPTYQCFIKLTALVAGRLSEVIALTWDDYHESVYKDEETLLVPRLKGSRDTLMRVGPNLRDVLSDCKALGDHKYILHSRGHRLTKSGVQSYWRRLMAQYEGEPFSIHLLRHYGISNGASGGHKTVQQEAAYSHKPIISDTADF